MSFVGITKKIQIQSVKPLGIFRQYIDPIISVCNFFIACKIQASNVCILLAS